MASVYPCVCPGHTKAVVELQYSAVTPDGQFFISACLDKEPMLRDATSGDWIGTLKGHKGAVWSAKLNSDASMVATGSADFTVKLWNACTGDEIASLEHSHVVRCVDFSHDGLWLATGCQDKKLRVWDVSSRAVKFTLTLPDKIRKLLWAPGDASLWVACEDGFIRVVDVAAGVVAREAALAAPAPLCDLEYATPTSGAVLTVAAGQSVYLVDPITLAVRHTHALGAATSAASLHPITGAIFIAGSDVHVRVMDAVTGAEISIQKGHHGIVHCVRFAPDGATFASGADDATIRLWSTAECTAAAGMSAPAASAAS